MSAARAARWAFVIASCCAAAIGPGRVDAAPRGATTAKAPAGARIDATVDRPVVEIGAVVTYRVSVSLSEGGGPVTAAGSGATPGFDAIGRPFTSTETHIVQQGGTIEQVAVVGMSWKLRAKTLGEHVLGPGKVTIAGVSYDAPSVKVKVVGVGEAPAPKRPRSAFPFDIDDDDFEPPPPPPPTAHEPLDPLAKIESLPTARADRDVFVRVVVDPRAVVIGAQATAKVFVYARGRARITVKRPPVFADFATLELGQPDHEWHPITIGAEDWAYANVAAYAIFPLKTGKLVIGPAEIESTSTDPFRAPSVDQDHASAPVTLETTEPPLDGRPPEYRVGDVASELAVAADVAPRETADGHSVLTVRMTGVGRLENLEPVMPKLAGVSFSRTNDDTKTISDGVRIRSRRSIVYDVAASRAGDYALGDARVIVWDPATSKYVDAHATLGAWKAKGVVASAPAGAASSEPKLDLPPPRADAGDRGEGTTIADRAWTWLVVAGAPLLVLSAQAAAKGARTMRKRVVAHREDPLTRARAALREARACAQAGDHKGAAAAAARAIELAVEAVTTGRARVRGMTSAEVRERLPAAGLDEGLADRIATTIQALETARFAGAAGPRAGEVSALVDTIAAAAPQERVS